MTRIGPKLLLLVVTSALCLGGAEWVMRSWFRSAPQLDLDIYRKDADGLLLLRPQLERRHVTRYWDVTVRTNSRGRRDDEPAPQPGERLVLGLGDSFAFGWGVKRNQSFIALIEEGLRQTRPTRLIQAGVPGTSTLDQARLLPKLLAEFGPSHVPEHVLLAFFVGNDFTETGLGGAKRLRVVDGLLELRPLSGEPASGWSERARHLLRRSRLLQMLRAMQWNWFRGGSPQGPPRTWDEWMRAFAQQHLRTPSKAALRATQDTLAALERIATACEEVGARLTLIVIPRSVQVYDAEADEMLSALGLDQDDVDLDRPQRVLAEWAVESGVDLIDLLPGFRRAAAQGRSFYYTPDAHFNPAGHALAAREALAQLCRDCVVGESDASLERQ